VESSSVSHASKFLESANCKSITGSREGEGDAIKFPVAGVPFPRNINSERDNIFSFRENKI